VEESINKRLMLSLLLRLVPGESEEDCYNHQKSPLPYLQNTEVEGNSCILLWLNTAIITVEVLVASTQWFSTFVRPRPGKFFFL
jgi:hypothetical protein